MALPLRATDTWLATLLPCTAQQYRSKLTEGGQPVFALTPNAKANGPEWWLLFKDRDGALFRVITNKNPVCRRINSLKVAYRIARSAGLETLKPPVNLKGTP
jgi:hypothetical protein